MSEVVEIILEKSVFELERLVALGLFDQSEVRKIAQERRDISYSLQKRTKDKRDYLKFIRYEEDLLKRIKTRRLETGIKERWAEVDLQIMERLQRFFRATVERFQADVNLWLGYFKFCSKHKFFILGNKMLQRLVQVHGDKPHLWIFASQWSLKKKKKEKTNWEAGRTWLVTGLQRHPHSKELYLALVKFDLDLVEWASNASNEEDIEPDLIKKCLACAEISYKSAVKNILEAKFCAEFVDLIKNYPQATDLLKLAVSNLEENFPKSEESWNSRAMFALQHAQPPSIVNLDDNQTVEFRLEKCLEVFREAVENLSTPLMWRKYIDFIKSALKNHEDLAVPDLKAELFRRALPGAIEKSLASEDDYAELADYQLSKNKPMKAVDTLEKGLVIFPRSCGIWYELVRVHLTLGENKKANEVFRKAVVELKTAPAAEVTPLWTMMIEFLVEDGTHQEEIEEIFKESLRYSIDLAQILKPQYLEWRHKTCGLEKARELLTSAYVTNPPCFAFYQKLIEIECSQDKLDVEKIRFHFENVLRLFGTSNAQLWMDYINFEKQHGQARAIVKIYERGIGALQKEHVDELITTYALSF